MTIRLSERGEKLIHALVEAGRYASGDDVIDEALSLLEQRDLREAREKRRIESLLLEGLESGPSTPMTTDDWDEIEREGRRLIDDRKGRAGR